MSDSGPLDLNIPDSMSESGPIDLGIPNSTINETVICKEMAVA